MHPASLQAPGPPTTTASSAPTPTLAPSFQAPMTYAQLQMNRAYDMQQQQQQQQQQQHQHLQQHQHQQQLAMQGLLPQSLSGGDMRQQLAFSHGLSNAAAFNHAMQLQQQHQQQQLGMAGSKTALMGGGYPMGLPASSSASSLPMQQPQSLGMVVSPTNSVASSSSGAAGGFANFRPPQQISAMYTLPTNAAALSSAQPSPHLLPTSTFSRQSTPLEQPTTLRHPTPTHSMPMQRPPSFPPQQQQQPSSQQFPVRQLSQSATPPSQPYRLPPAGPPLRQQTHPGFAGAMTAMPSPATAPLQFHPRPPAAAALVQSPPSMQQQMPLRSQTHPPQQPLQGQQQQQQQQQTPSSTSLIPPQQQQQQQQHSYESLGPQYKAVVSQSTLRQFVRNEKRWERSHLVARSRNGQTLKAKRSEVEALMAHERKMSDLYGSSLGRGYRTGPDKTLPRFQLIMPRERQASKLGFSGLSSSNPLAGAYEAAAEDEVLVPIRLDIEHDGLRLRDTFTWNINDTTISPEAFADTLCNDLGLPRAVMAEHIVAAIKEQLQDCRIFGGRTGNNREPATAEERDSLIADDELRITIKIDVTISSMSFVDQFEWDINCRKNSPELFAQSLCAELGLVGEFQTAIAHSIREQIYQHHKGLIQIDYPFDGSFIANYDKELASNFLVSVEERFVVRDADYLDHYTPQLMQVNEDEVDRVEKDRDRDARRKRRGQRRGKATNAVIDHREPVKTHRTPTTRTRVDMRLVRNFADHIRQGLVPYHDNILVPRSTREQLPRRVPVSATHWRCRNCSALYDETPMPRQGPEGERVLCTLCGIHYAMYGTMRPVPAHQQQRLAEAVHEGNAIPLAGQLVGNGAYNASAFDASGFDEPLPLWMIEKKSEMQIKYPDDRFEVVKKGDSMRIRCFDCERGRLYNASHLSYRGHRATVAARLSNPKHDGSDGSGGKQQHANGKHHDSNNVDRNKIPAIDPTTFYDHLSSHSASSQSPSPSKDRSRSAGGATSSTKSSSSSIPSSRKRPHDSTTSPTGSLPTAHARRRMLILDDDASKRRRGLDAESSYEEDRSSSSGISSDDDDDGDDHGGGDESRRSERSRPVRLASNSGAGAAAATVIGASSPLSPDSGGRRLSMSSPSLPTSPSASPSSSPAQPPLPQPTTWSAPLSQPLYDDDNDDSDEDSDDLSD